MKWIVQLFDYRRGVTYMQYVETPTRERGREILRALKPLGIHGYVTRKWTP